MPSYVYQCKEKHERDVTHSIADTPDIKCQVCQASMERKPQTITSKFIGKGFYRNDRGDA
jgi:predicted nucleic acid-binding Zn ribbon protein